jgi:hypothetical protein
MGAASMSTADDLFAENREKLESYLLQNRILRGQIELVVNKPAKPNAKKLLKASQKRTLKAWGES